MSYTEQDLARLDGPLRLVWQASHAPLARSAAPGDSSGTTAALQPRLSRRAVELVDIPIVVDLLIDWTAGAGAEYCAQLAPPLPGPAALSLRFLAFLLLGLARIHERRSLILLRDSRGFLRRMRLAAARLAAESAAAAAAATAAAAAAASTAAATAAAGPDSGGGVAPLGGPPGGAALPAPSISLQDFLSPRAGRDVTVPDSRRLLPTAPGGPAATMADDRWPGQLGLGLGPGDPGPLLPDTRGGAGRGQ
ncbi:hypothetical protein H696_05617 [Fonticula alba]|uniref:Rad21/Rec8-like protein N-terminal domain-containing protein n=1 Tax=Fonticula alba TaxID=691883 RepID=A0A058Z1T0_FONAL|nr:hypothetical protein H696_05617 [Fonticula alba]KCV67888.1 hypothetical protein H696_05617 [Fonticula alba]|eukprot:XP_009497708.1 hypothetical protein H696_05617 [Fonticula alba]